MPSAGRGPHHACSGLRRAGQRDGGGGPHQRVVSEEATDVAGGVRHGGGVRQVHLRQAGQVGERQLVSPGHAGAREQPRRQAADFG